MMPFFLGGEKGIEKTVHIKDITAGLLLVDK